LGLLGGGGYTYSVVYSKTTEANELSQSAPGYKDDLRQLSTDRDSYMLYTVILAGVGGAAVGGGLLMVLLDDDEGDDEGATLEILSLGAVPTPGGMVFGADFGF
jgi:hypothetical protein